MLPQLLMSALPLKADMCGATRDVRFGPIADIRKDNLPAIVSFISVSAAGAMELGKFGQRLQSRKTGTSVRHWLSDCEKVCCLQCTR
jgi:hypothetical protein